MGSIPPTMTTMQGTQSNDYHPIVLSIVIMHPLILSFHLTPSFTLICLKPICVSHSESNSKQVKILKQMQKYFQLTIFSQHVQWHRFVYQQ